MVFEKSPKVRSRTKILKMSSKKVNPKLAVLVLLLWGCLVILVFLKSYHYPAEAPLKSKINFRQMRNFIHRSNTQQLIRNQNKTNSIRLVIVIEVHDNKTHFEELVTSLSLARNIQDTLLIFSHDSFQTFHHSIISNIKFARTMQIFYPLSIQTHPNEFPGPTMKDFSGKVRRNASQTQKKHHWWWTSNFVFNRVRILGKYEGLVLFLDENNYLSPDFIHCLHLMKDYMGTCPHCWFFSLTLQQNLKFRKRDYNKLIMKPRLKSHSLAFNRTVWKEISQLGESFCKFDDDSWEWSLKYITEELFGEYGVSTMAAVWPRAVRVTTCGARCKDFFQYGQFPKILKTKELTKTDDYVIASTGGWEDARDQALCMGM